MAGCIRLKRDVRFAEDKMSSFRLRALALSVACLVMSAVAADAQFGRRGGGGGGAVARPSFSRPSFGGGGHAAIARPMIGARGFTRPSFAGHSGRLAFAARSFNRPAFAAHGGSRVVIGRHGVGSRGVAAR
jgi:hypothetical protein